MKQEPDERWLVRMLPAADLVRNKCWEPLTLNNRHFKVEEVSSTKVGGTSRTTGATMAARAASARRSEACKRGSRAPPNQTARPPPELLVDPS